METSRISVGELPWLDHPTEHGLKTKPLGELPQRALTVRLNRIPATGAPEHAHPNAHFLFVLRGRGKIWVEGSGDMELAPEVFVTVAPHLRHRIHEVEDPIDIVSVSIRPSD
jgi:quercetin dioxygenase-like cupin family protein